MTDTPPYEGPPRRFEAVVRDLLGGVSRRLVRRLVAEGAATLNGRPARKGQPVRTGDRVVVPELPPLAAEPSLGVRLVDVSGGLVVLDKPPAMPTLPLDPDERGSLAGFVLAIFPECRHVAGPLDAGVAHRLDTGSSGLVLAARTSALWRELRAAFAARRVEKSYLAVVAGSPRAVVVDLPLGHDPADPRRMIPSPPQRRAWTARTSIEPLRRGRHVALVRATIRTGVTHQVRAHLAAAGMPIVGDALYGGPMHPGLTARHALHASAIVVPELQEHPGGRWHSELPGDMAALLDA